MPCTNVGRENRRNLVAVAGQPAARREGQSRLRLDVDRENLGREAMAFREGVFWLGSAFWRSLPSTCSKKDLSDKTQCGVRRSPPSVLAHRRGSPRLPRRPLPYVGASARLSGELAMCRATRLFARDRTHIFPRRGYGDAASGVSPNRFPRNLAMSPAPVARISCGRLRSVPGRSGDVLIYRRRQMARWFKEAGNPVRVDSAFLDHPRDFNEDGSRTWS
jgi:hypothetical protein